MFTFPLLLAIYSGFTHAFEADHLLAVNNIVSQRSNIKSSVKDGIYWGLGHASTIFFIGILMILFKAVIAEKYFHYFEATVGFMLILLAIYRFRKFFARRKNFHAHSHDEIPHQQIRFDGGKTHKHQHPHSLAYSVGLVHGLAGSGVLVVAVMSQIKNPLGGLTYLLIFGTACIAGMMLAAGLFSVPFSKKMMKEKALQTFLIIASSALCLVYGAKVIYDNLIA